MDGFPSYNLENKKSNKSEKSFSLQGCVILTTAWQLPDDCLTTAYLISYKTKWDMTTKQMQMNTFILFYKQRFISNTQYKKTSWTVAYKTEWVEASR